MKKNKPEAAIGLFETMRSFNGKIVYLDEHLKRIFSAAKLMRMQNLSSAVNLKKLIQDTVKSNKIKDSYLKLVFLKNKRKTDISVLAKKYHPFNAKKYKEGFRVRISSFWKDESHPFAGLKTTDRLIYELSFQEARAKGFDEALLLNCERSLAEGSRSNIFFVKDKILFTPSLKCGCLNGITRKVVFDLAQKYKIRTKEGIFSVGDLLDADEAFFTNSLMGIMPVGMVEHNKIGKGANKITKFLMEKYQRLLCQ